MALRLTKTSLPQTEPVAAARRCAAAQRSRHRAENATVSALGARAGLALGGTDLAALPRQLFDCSRRAREPAPPVPGCASSCSSRVSRSLRGASEKRATEMLLAMASGAIAALEADPAEPVLLNYAGVAPLRAVGARCGAGAVPRRRKRLDPDLPHLERNLKEVSNRGRSGNHRKLAFHPALADLTKRAKRVAVARQAGAGLAPEPLHDRPRRGGDAPAHRSRRSRPPSTRSSSSTPARRTARSRSQSRSGRR